MVNTDAIDGLIDLLVGEAVIDACANHFQKQQVLNEHTNAQSNITKDEFYSGQNNVVCSIGKGNDNYFVGCIGLEVKAN